MATVYSQLYADNRIKNAERKQQVELNEQLRVQKLEEEANNNVNFWEKLGVTIADVFTELGGGLLKLVEGVADAGISIAGGVGGLFGADTKWAEDIVKFDATQEWYYGAFEDEFTKNSFINDAPIVKDVIRGIGQQLPTIAAVALAPITGGGSLAALPYTVGATIASAGGGGVEEGLNDGAKFGEAFAYGLLQSGIEFGVEFATAGMGKGITSIGKSVGKSATKTVAKSTGKVILEESLSEFVEEGLSALLNPATKAMTYQGVDALDTYRDMTFYLGAMEQALVGGIVGGLTGGATALGKSRVYGGNKSYNIAQSVTEIQSIETKENNLYKNGKLKQEVIDANSKQRDAELKNISEKLKEMNDADRKKTIEQFELSEIFEENGDIIEVKPLVEQTVDANGNVSNTPLISGNIDAYSPSLRNKNLLFKPTNNQLTENSKNAKKFVMTLDTKAKSVFSDSLPKGVNAFYDTNSKVLYMSNNITTDALMGHEITHALEGTKEYSDLKSYVLKDLKQRLTTDEYNDLVNEKIRQYKKVNQEVKKGKNGKFVALYEAETEIVADEMGKLLSDPESIRRIVRQNSYNKAYKIWQWIKDTLAKLTKRGDKGEYYQYIRNAEKLYAKAIQSSVGGISLTQVRMNIDDAIKEFEKLAKEESGKSIANSNDIRYNMHDKPLSNTKTGIKLSKQEYAVLKREVVRKNANSKEVIPIDYDYTANNFYIYENYGDDNFRPILKLDIEKNHDLIKAIEEELKNGTIRKPKTFSEWARIVRNRRKSNNRNSSISTNRGTNRADAGLSIGESTSDTKRDSKPSGDNNRYSLTHDSDGKELTKEQQEFFKNSKIIDDKGNLLTVYHGTDASFYTFRNKPAQYGRAITDGFYFTLKQENATNYGKNVKNVYLNIKNPFYLHWGDGVLAELANRDYPISRLVDEFNCEIDEVGLPTSKALKKVLQKLGYDGVVSDTFDNTDNIDTEYSETQIVAFNANQIKLTTNENPTGDNDIRYSLEDGSKGYDKYSKGQIAKYIAEHSKKIAYSRADAEKVVNTIVAQTLSFGEKYGEIGNKTKEQVIDQLWHTYNTRKEGYGLNMLDDIAEFIINNAVVEDIRANEARDSQIDAAMFTIDKLNHYIHGVDLKGVKGEIAYKYDDKQAKIYGRWNQRAGRFGSSPDQIAQELESEGIFFKSNVSADILFEMNDMWENANRDLKKIAKEKLTDLRDEIDLNELKTKIRDDLLKEQDNVGHKTRFAETIEYYTSKISNLKNAVKDIKVFNKAKNNAISTIERLRDEFVKNKPAGWKVPEQVVNFVKKIARVETWRNDISKNAREYLRELEANIDMVMDEQQQSIYPYREIIKEIASGSGNLTTQELVILDNVLRQFAWQLRNYDKVNFENKNQSIEELSTHGVNETKQAQKILKSGDSILAKFKNKIYTNPYERVAEMGLYREDSIAMRLFAEIKDGDRRRASFVRDASTLFDEFFTENKNYLDELQKEITIGSGEKQIKITKRQALSIFATSLREQGRNHLFNLSYDSGVIRILDNELSTKGRTVEAFARGKDVEINQAMIDEIKKSLSDADKKYLKLTDKFFNEMSRNAKSETDKKLFGITNVENDSYFPLSVSKDKIYTEAGQRNNNINQYVLNMGMNMTTKPHASNKLVFDGIDNIVATHIKNMSMYYGYALPLTAYNRIMNKQVLNDDGADNTSNIRGEIAKIDSGFEKYMDKLWQDIQGISYRDKSFVSDVLSKIRWAGANAALGLNPKVLVTQTLSLASGVSEFNPKYIAKGMGHFFGEKNKIELSKYSSLMWERMQIGNSIDIADIRQIGKQIGSGVKGAVGKSASKVAKGLTTLTTKPISWMDSNVIQTLWFAAQYEIADTKGKGYEFGTDANKLEAGKRLDDVVFRTQQTSDPLGRSEWMRSQNEIVKFARMFTGDALQLTGKLISSVNKYNVAKRMIKSGDIELVERGKTLLGEAKVSLAKSGSAFMLNQVFLLAIAMAFKWIKGIGDDDEWDDIVKNEAIANIMGLIPFGGDIYDKILGYEPTNMAYTALSDSIEIAINLVKDTTALIKGDYQDPVKRNAAIRRTALSMSKLFGIPLQNLESYTKGIVGKISPGTKEEYEALYKTKTNTIYYKKLKQATESGDEDYANTIVNLMFDSRTGKIKDDKVLKITRDLIESGYDVMPKVVGNTITYDGETHTLTSRQHSQFSKIYSQANESIKNMVNSTMFNNLDDAAKAKAMNFIYNYYWDIAIEDLLGEDLESKTIMFAEIIPIEQLAMAVSQARLFEADIDKTGKSISGTKKAKVQSFINGLKLSAVQKYMIMGYLGYSNKYGDTLVKTYINRLSMTKEQKSELYKMSGYVA